MRIIYLSGANSIHSYKWIRYFAKQNFEIVWVSLTENEFEIIDNVKYINVGDPKSAMGLLGCIYRLKMALTVSNTDVIHMHSIGTYGLLGLILSLQNKVKLVASPWGSDLIFGRKNIFKNFIIGKILARANLITCDAYFIKDMVTPYVNKNQKIAMVNFGVDTSRFRPRHSSIKKNVRGDKKFKIISTRNFEEVYDIETLIRACYLLKQKNSNFHLTLVGGGSRAGVLEIMVSEMGLERYVKFAGRVANEDLPDLLNGFDAYVSTALSDAGIAASTAEAMACGLPVIVTNVAENSLWINEGENGFMYQPSDEFELVKKLDLIRTHVDSLVGKLARQAILKRNDYTKEMAKMHNLYLELANED